MSKIICDVCGTAYAENAAQCPICGSAKRGDAKGNLNKAKTDTAEGSSYQYVKGGRFSKQNVRKRNMESQKRQSQNNGNDGEDTEEKSSKGLIVLMLILLAAVIAVIIYILLRIFGTGADVPDTKPSENPKPSTSISTEDTGLNSSEPSSENTEPSEETVPCEGLILHEPQIVLDEPGATTHISVSVSPANTTDLMTLVSSDESVVTVSDDGMVTAVGEGSAYVTISCGRFHVNCNITVAFETEPTTEPVTEPSTEPTTEPQPVIELNRDDITFRKKGETWTLYNGNLPLNQITWTSDDESIATFQNGKVTAVAPGKTEVHAEYNGVKVSCIIRCNWVSDEPTSEPTEGPTLNENETYTINKTDVSISVGESFYLTLTDSNGKVVSVDWVASQDGYVTISGNKITGVKSINKSSFTVSVTIGEKTYSCIVRVR